MAQSGFAMFFLAVLFGCIFGLVAWMRLHWQTIMAAMRGDVPGPRPVTYRSASCRPIDVPYVAQRMLAQPGGGIGSLAARPAWRPQRQRPAGHQLAFSF